MIWGSGAGEATRRDSSASDRRNEGDEAEFWLEKPSLR